MPLNTKTPDASSLKEIRNAIAEIDFKRNSKLLSDEQLELLELSAIALRDSERLVMSKLQEKVVVDMEEVTNSLNLLAKEIRSKVTAMNKASKEIDAIESVIKTVVKIIGTIIKWYK